MRSIEDMMLELSDWLSDPAELGRRPSKIEYVKTIKDSDAIECHIFKFRTELLDPWKLGIVSESGTFSDMKPFLEETADEDALAILDMLKVYWERMAATLAPLPNEE